MKGSEKFEGVSFWDLNTHHFDPERAKKDLDL